MNSAVLLAQDYTLVKTIEAKADFIQTDKLSNLYIVQDYSVKKYKADGTFLYEYEDYTQGKISQIDVTDPLKVVLFFEDFLSIKVLDKTLSEMSTYDFSTTSFYTIPCIAHSRDDNFWLFDGSAAQLKKVNESGEVYNESESFYNIIDEEIIPIYIVEQEALVFLTDGEHGIYVFDDFGTFLKRIPILEVSFFQIVQDKIVYWKDGVLNSYHLKTFEEQQMQVSDELSDAKQVVLVKEYVYVCVRNKVLLYQLTE